jgi:predicted NAD-dependent protein-ADP-ribosyltransferase YbiA (DUF1768 family)
MRAKMVAKKDGRRKNHSRPDWASARIDIMRWRLRVKLHCWPMEFGCVLLKSSDREIIEKSSRDVFWGAKEEVPGCLVGDNWLGLLLMDLRKEFKNWVDSADDEAEFPCPPPRVPVRLLGQDIR